MSSTVSSKVASGGAKATGRRLSLGKNAVNKVLNLALYLLFCTGFGIGLLLWYGLPAGQGRAGGGGGRGSGGGGGWRGGRGGDDGVERVRAGAHAEWLGLDRHDWGDVHLYVMLAFAALCALHLWLNRVWLAKIAAKGGSWKLWGGLALGAVVIGFFAIGPVLG